MAVASAVLPKRSPTGLGMRLRADLVLAPQQFGTIRYWVIKDPVTLRYFHLRDEELALLEMLADAPDLDTMVRRFERRFPPQHLSAERVHAFLAKAHRQGLLVADRPGQETQLLKRREESQRRRWAWSWTRLLAIRFRGVDPDRWLDDLAGVFRPIFTLWFQCVALLAAVCAATLVAVNFDEVMRRLPEFDIFFRSDQLVWFFVVLAGVKVLHELGHAIACKYFGGECHEIGAMLLVFTPCLYCNVSDSWLLPNKWRRIAIAAAGMWVELMLAVGAVFVWYFSQPGLLNTLALRTMFICGIGTVLINGNPLLRYDGYYILSDLVEMPNLAERSQGLVRRMLAKVCLGLDPASEPIVSERHGGGLLAYAVASMLYRLFVLGLILWFLWKVLLVARLQSLAVFLTLVVGATLVAPPLLAAVRLAKNPIQRRAIRKKRLLLTLCVLTAVAVGVAMIPLPYSIEAPIVVEAADANRVYVTVPGKLTENVAVGTQVSAGDPIGTLESVELAAKIVELQGRHERQRLHLNNLLVRRGDDAEAESQIPAARAALTDIASQLAERRRQQHRLALVAPASGTVLPPPRRPAEPAAGGELPAWHGTPLEARNRGMFLQAGTHYCTVGDPHRVEVILFVDQGEVDHIRRKQPVEFRVDQRPGQVFHGTVTDVAAVDLKVLPRELIGRTDVLSMTDEAGVARPVDTLYRVRVAIEGPAPRFTLGARGTARIAAGERTLGRRGLNYLQRTFRFEL